MEANTKPRLVRPMLAKTYEDRLWTPGGMFLQPKLNGIRAMYQNGVFMSRDGHPWNPRCLRSLREKLRNLPPDIILDGELYCHGTPLQTINSRIAVTRTEPHQDEVLVDYWIFDIVSNDPFHIRHSRLVSLHHATAQEGMIYVQTIFCYTPTDAEYLFQEWKTHGYEGAMYRDPHAPYSLPETCGNKQNRVKSLLKRKEWLDLDATIQDVVEGTGQFLGMCGALYCVAPTGATFSVGSGLTHKQREWLWQNREQVLGHPVKVQFEMMSNALVPLKPIIIQLPICPF